MKYVMRNYIIFYCYTVVSVL